MVQTYSIGDLAREFEVTSRAIRFYEAEGLIAPLREGQRRIYRPRDRVRLKLVLRGKRLGFSLQEIREIIDLYDAPRAGGRAGGRGSGEAVQLKALMAKIAARRDDLEAKLADAQAAIAHLDGVQADCRRRLEALAPERAPDAETSLRERARA